MPNQPNLDLMFQALGDPARRAIIDQLSKAPASVSELARPLAVSLPTVLQHLEMLEECGLVCTEKIGRVRSCSLEPEGLSLAENWIASRRQLWERRLHRLGEYLAKGKSRTVGARPRRRKK